MYSEIEPEESDPPSVITLKCRWSILNPTAQPLTLHKVAVSVSRADAWHTCMFEFEEVVPPNGNETIVIVPIKLTAKETAEYLKDGVEHSIAIDALYTGINGRQSSQHWGDLFYFREGNVEWNHSLGKGPQHEYDEPYKNEGTIRESGKLIYEPPKPN